MKISVKKLKENYEEFMPAATFEYSVNISVKNSYMYFETAKVACSTIKKTLQNFEFKSAGLDVLPEIKNVHSKVDSPLLSPLQVGLEKFCDMLNDENVIKFSFIRNPYSRALSAFLDKMSYESKEKQKIANVLGIEISSNIAFLDFLKAVDSTPLVKMDHHWRPQYYQLLMGLVDYNYVGYFENFAEDFNAILSKIYGEDLVFGRNEKLVKHHAPHSTKASSKLVNYYNNETIDLVKKIYDKDFRSFNYAYELPLKYIDESYISKFARGEALAKAGNLDEAVDAYCESIKANPDYSWSYHCLGNVLFWKHEFKEALLAYQKAVVLDPKLSAAYVRMGDILSKLGKTSEAEAAYAYAKEMDAN